MSTFTVRLPDDLAEFVRRCVAAGSFPSADELFAHAVELARAERTPAAVPSAPVDLTRQGFDSPAFLANLVGKLEQKRIEERERERRLEQPR